MVFDERWKIRPKPRRANEHTRPQWHAPTAVCSKKSRWKTDRDTTPWPRTQPSKGGNPL
jgi:hypothetical protein